MFSILMCFCRLKLPPTICNVYGLLSQSEPTILVLPVKLSTGAPFFVGSAYEVKGAQKVNVNNAFSVYA